MTSPPHIKCPFCGTENVEDCENIGDLPSQYYCESCDKHFDVPFVCDSDYW